MVRGISHAAITKAQRTMTRISSPTMQRLGTRLSGGFKGSDSIASGSFKDRSNGDANGGANGGGANGGANGAINGNGGLTAPSGRRLQHMWSPFGGGATPRAAAEVDVEAGDQNPASFATPPPLGGLPPDVEETLADVREEMLSEMAQLQQQTVDALVRRVMARLGNGT